MQEFEPLTPAAPAASAPALVTPGAKLRPPRLPSGLLERSLLDTLIHGWQSHRLTLVTAPAGYGKTTLAAAALQAAAAAGSPLQPVWLALDDDDDDGARFLLALATALNRLIPGQTRSAVEIAFGAGNPRQAMQHLLIALEEAALPVLLILDDFHRLQSQEVRDLMHFALERSPDNLRWMILARHAAPVPLGKLRLQGQLLEIGADALRLTRTEIADLAARSGLPTLDDPTLDLLEARTHGWIAGLHLTLLSLHRAPGAEPGGVSAPDSDQADADRILGRLRKDNDLLTEYLTTEVLARLAEPLRSFLLECAILDRLHPGLCTAVTGVLESRQVIAQALAQQLFVSALQGDGDWFEMHSLFRDLLLHQLRIERSAAEVQTLYRRAADWHLARNDTTAAVRALLACDLPHLAAEIVQQRTRIAMAQSDFFGPLRWISLLPAAQLEIRPQLLLDQAWAVFLAEVKRLPETLQHARRALAALPSVPAGLRDELAALTLAERYRFGPKVGLFEDARAVAAACQPESHFARGLALVHVGGNAPESMRAVAHAAIVQAVEEFAFVGVSMGAVIFDWWQAVFESRGGNPEVALQACSRYLETMTRQSKPAPFSMLIIHALRAELLYRLDRIDEATQELRHIQADADHYGYRYFQLYAHLGLALCRVDHGSAAPSTPETRRDEDHLWSRFAASAPMNLMAQAMLLHLWCCARTGRTQEGWARFAVLGLDLHTLPDDADDVIWLTVLTAHVLRGVDLEPLLPRVQMLLERVTAAGCLSLSIPLGLLQTLIEYRLGRRNVARSILRRTLRDVEQTGYHRMVLDQPELLPLLRVAGGDLAERLAARMEAEQATRSQVLAPQTEQLLTERQVAILRLLSREQSLEDVARQTSLSVETVKWYRKKIYAALGVTSRTQALVRARLHGLL